MRKRFLALVLLVTTLFMLSAVVTAEETLSFETPEAVLEFFYEGLIENDLDKMMASSQIDYADRFDYMGNVREIRMIAGQSPYGAPKEYELFRELTAIMLEAKFAIEIRNLTYSLLLDEPYLDMIRAYGTMVPMDEDDIDLFLEQVDPARLSELEIVKIEPVEDVVELKYSYEDYVKRQLRVYDADDYAERLILLELDGEHYVAGATILQFGEDWRIVSLYSTIAGTPLFGSAVLIDDFRLPSPGGP